jgi:hypothetical protein
MKPVRIFALALALCVIAPAAFGQTFEVGQVWSLKPPMDPAARIRIGRVEDEGRIVHISLWGQPASRPGLLGPSLAAGHLPISSEALAASVDQVVPDEPPTELMFDEGYAEWQSARGGVFTIPVSQIAVVLEQMAARLPAATQK